MTRLTDDDITKISMMRPEVHHPNVAPLHIEREQPSTYDLPPRMQLSRRQVRCATFVTMNHGGKGRGFRK